MAARSAVFLSKPATLVATDDRFPLKWNRPSLGCFSRNHQEVRLPRRQLRVIALDQKREDVGGGSGSGGDSKKAAVPNSNYVVPLDKSAPSLTRPLAEILRDLNKRIPENILKPNSKIISWCHANRMLSFYAPGWCGEVRDVIFSDTGSVTVVYRVTIRGSDGEAYRESTGTISSNEQDIGDPVAAAEEVAFVKACARFGLGLYLYHDE